MPAAPSIIGSMAFHLLLHEGVVPEALRPRLAEGIRRIYADIFGAAESVSVEVTEIPKGRFFTAAEPSRTSIIGGSVPAGTSRADRTRFMSEVTAMWCEVTGCTPNDVVISAADAPA